jgi:hypothetical protein
MFLCSLKNSLNIAPPRVEECSSLIIIVICISLHEFTGWPIGHWQCTQCENSNNKIQEILRYF